MSVCRSCSAYLTGLRLGRSSRSIPVRKQHRAFHATRTRDVVKPFLLADIGEGTRECQIIQWFVQPGARVEQFDKLCEVQSDKTATDITSPFDGVIKKLHYETDDMAIVGKPLVDIDIQNDVAEDEPSLGGEQESPATTATTTTTARASPTPSETASTPPQAPTSAPTPSGQYKSLSTPAVRHLCKEMKLNVEDITGTGKDGRVTKEDVQRHLDQPSLAPESTILTLVDKKVALTPVQSAMFKAMTRSLTIPHFLYTMTVDMTSLTALRKRINSKREKSQRITPLPFILKAVSLAFAQHPLLNASLDLSDPKKPELNYRAAHNFGIAVDTPAGLVVPVVRNVQNQSISSLASSIKQISEKASSGKLQPSDLQGGTFTVSNIGSIGGGVVSPIIVEPQVGIVGVGRSKVVPAFDETGALVQREELILSWSADHRVVDGAECARMAEKVKQYLEGIDEWVLEMR